MARGKHSSAAAIRRAEAAHEHIDRLTDQLVEVKAKARRYEAAALRVPAMEEEIRRLRDQVEQGSSAELEKCRAERESDRVYMAEKLLAIGILVGQIDKRYAEGKPNDRHPDADPEDNGFLGHEVARLSRLLGPEAMKRGFGHFERDMLRYMATGMPGPSHSAKIRAGKRLPPGKHSAGSLSNAELNRPSFTEPISDDELASS